MLAKSMPPCRPHTGDAYFDSLLEPARFYAHPKDVLVDQRLNVARREGADLAAGEIRVHVLAERVLGLPRG